MKVIFLWPLIVVALYVALNAILYGVGFAVYRLAQCAAKSLNRRSERFWRDRS